MLTYQRIAYVSRAAPGITSRDAHEIVRRAHQRNRRGGLTGGLLMLDGFFAQVLEGEASRVRECFERILADRRHVEVQLRCDRAVPERLFDGQCLALGVAAQVDAGLRASFGYLPGLPGARFEGDRLSAFVHAGCRAALRAPAVPV